MVAALRMGRYFVASSSAARRKMAARSTKGIRAHSSFTASAFWMACSTWLASASCSVASTCECLCGIRTVSVLLERMRLPPMTIGISICSEAMRLRVACSSARSGLPGAWERTGSFCGGGTRTLALITRSSSGEKSGKGRRSIALRLDG